MPRDGTAISEPDTARNSETSASRPGPIEGVMPEQVRSVLWRVLLVTAAVSGAINLLQLAPALYMYQVYDRVLSTQHLETLVAITMIVVLALVLLAVLDAARNAVGQRLGAWLERTLAGPVLHATVHGAPLVGTARGAQALRDLSTVRGAIGQMTWPLLDAPWSPIFFAVAFLIHPLLGWIGVAGGIALFGLAITNELLTRRAIQRSTAGAIATIGDADAAVRNADSLIAMGMLPAWLGLWHQQREAVSEPQSAAGMRSGIVGAIA